jgi:S-methylmethionine-dependent homocysteine/selenocysteine methylase
MTAQIFQNAPFLIVDGAFATCLEQSHGVQLHHTLWSAAALRTHPNTIKQVHLEYLGSFCNSSSAINWHTRRDAAWCRLLW